MVASAVLARFGFNGGADAHHQSIAAGRRNPHEDDFGAGRKFSVPEEEYENLVNGGWGS